MKKIFCELHMFDLHQQVFILDAENNNKTCVAITTMEQLPEVISALSNEKNISKVVLSGNSIFSAAVSEDILAYSKKHYSWNNIEVEVLK